MSRKLLASLFCGLGLLVFAASGQQPNQPPPKSKTTEAAPFPGQLGKGGDTGAGNTKKADPTDALVQAALMNDPDVKLAQAKMQLAEAEIAKARQAVVLKVMNLNATIQELKTQVASLTEGLANSERFAKTGVVSIAQVAEDRAKLEHAKATLARTEMELKLLTGGMQKELVGTTGASDSTAWFMQRMMGGMSPNQGQQTGPFGSESMKSSQGVMGPIPERIRALLDKPVKLGAKGEEVTFAKALEVFKKDAGLDVPVRLHMPQLTITSEGEVLPVGAWFQLFSDNNSVSFYVREYGLLVAAKAVAPPDAITVMELWKQPLKKSADPILRKYSVPAGTAEAIAKTLSQNEPHLRILALPVTNEIIVLATKAEHATLTGKLKDISGGEKMTEPKAKTLTDPN